MKKDQKFLLKLSDCLSKINDKKKNEIILKYRNIIDKEKENNKRIVDILKYLGSPEDIAEKEISLLKKNNIFSRIPEFFNKMNNKIKLLIQNKKTKKKIIIDKPEKPEKINKKKKKNNSKSQKTKVLRKIKWNFKKIGDKFKKKNKVEKAVDNIKEETSQIIENVTEIVTENKIYETKKHKIKRILLSFFGILVIIVFVFILLWATVVFIASLFSILDGLKVYGIVVALFGIMLFTLWMVLLMYNLIFKKKIKRLFFLISVIVIILIIGCGIGYSMYQYYKIQEVDDVSVKYTMTTKYEKFTLPSKKKLYITFNSNYKTEYVIEYDNSFENYIKVETKYYECYYDFYMKKTNNNLYVSLSVDNRDRLSAYIDDLKEYQLYNTDELKRYTVKIVMNEKDAERVAID